MYNDQDTDVVTVTLSDTSSIHNQLDQFPRRFHLAGNQEQEFLRYQQQQGSRPHYRQISPRVRGEEQENEGNNIFSGFAQEFLQHAFQVDRETVQNLRGENEREEEGAIVTVRGGLRILNPDEEDESSRSPPSRREEFDEDRYERQQRGKYDENRRRYKNGIEETICSASVKKNLGRSSNPDIYNPQAGSLRSVNELDLPILGWLGLSAQHGTLYRNAMFVPHYTLNAHTIVVALNGRAHVQVVDSDGNRVYDEELQEGHVLVVPQNFAVAAKAQSENYEYLAFKTDSRPSIANLAGENSIIDNLPEEVVANSYRLPREQARQLKNNNPFKFFVPPFDHQSMREVA
ncbi:hypothetical protein HN51_014355 [Arachis hypogaea]|nr:Arachin [Arachis hypogaea]